MKTGLGLKTAPVSLFQSFVIATAGFSQREFFSVRGRFSRRFLGMLFLLFRCRWSGMCGILA